MTTMVQYRQKPGVHMRQMDDQVFLADPQTDIMFHLNAIGSAVWRLLEQPMDSGEIAGLLVEAFPGTAANRIRQDVSILLEQLSDNGLVCEIPPG